MSRIDFCYEFALAVYSLCTTVFAAYCFAVFVRPFLSARRRAGAVGAVFAGIVLAADLVPFYVNVMAVYAAAMSASFLVMIWRDRSYFAQKLFLAVTFFCVRWQAFRVVACIGNAGHLLAGRLFSSENDWFWFYVFVLQLVSEALLGSLLMCGAFFCLRKAYGSEPEHMTGSEFFLLVMPSVSGLVAYAVLRYFNYVYGRDTGKSPFELYGGYDILMLLYSLFCFLVIFAGTYVFRRWKNESVSETQREVLARQIEDMKRSIAYTELLWQDMRSLRHDAKNHFITLERLWEKGSIQEAREYAAAFQRQLLDVVFEGGTGSPVTDVILSGRKKEMQEKGIRFACDFSFPGSGRIDAFDISVILNNALDNAAAAASKEHCPFVRLSSRRVKNMYIIEVANSFSGSLFPDKRTGLPRSEKASCGHGVGLLNIRRVAAKYYGDLEIGTEKCDGGACCVLRVMMQLL